MITTVIRDARRFCFPTDVGFFKLNARRKHRRWSKQQAKQAARAGDGDFHRRPFLTDRYLDMS